MTTIYEQVPVNPVDVIEGDVYRTNRGILDETGYINHESDIWFARWCENGYLAEEEDQIYLVSSVAGDERQRSYAYSRESFFTRFPNAERVFRA